MLFCEQSEASLDKTKGIVYNINEDMRIISTVTCSIALCGRHLKSGIVFGYKDQSVDWKQKIDTMLGIKVGRLTNS